MNKRVEQESSPFSEDKTSLTEGVLGLDKRRCLAYFSVVVGEMSVVESYFFTHSSLINSGLIRVRN